MSLRSDFISRVERIAIYKRDNATCLFCGMKITDIKKLSIDHVIPRSKGGSNDPVNLICACHKCNSSKQSLTISQFCSKAGLNKHVVKNRIKRQTKKAINKQAIYNISKNKPLRDKTTYRLVLSRIVQ